MGWREFIPGWQKIPESRDYLSDFGLNVIINVGVMSIENACTGK